MNTTNINGTEAQSRNTTRRVKAGRVAAPIDLSTTPDAHVEAVAKIHARKAKAKAAQPAVTEPTVTAQASAEALGGAQPAEQETASAFDRLNNAYADVMAQFSMPTWKRTMVAAVLSIASAAGSTYIVGTIASALMAGTMLLTGSSFLVFIIAVLGCLMSFYVGMKVAGKVATYVMTEQIDQDIAAAKFKVLSAAHRVRGWLGMGNEVQHA